MLKNTDPGGSPVEGDHLCPQLVLHQYGNRDLCPISLWLGTSSGDQGPERGPSAPVKHANGITDVSWKGPPKDSRPESLETPLIELNN